MPGNDKVIQVRITADRYCTSKKVQSASVFETQSYLAVPEKMRYIRCKGATGLPLI